MLTFITVMVIFIFFIGCATFNKVCRMFNIMMVNQRIITDNQKVIMEKIKQINGGDKNATSNNNTINTDT